MLKRLVYLFAVLMVGTAASASAQVTATNRLCDPGVQNCRTTSGLDPSGLLALINNETPSGGIDVSFWFMEDTRYSTALINAHKRGVPVRILFDERAYTSYGYTGAKAP